MEGWWVEMSNICYDLDGVLACFNHGYANLLISLSGKDLLPKGWRTDPNFPSVWYWERKYGYGGKWENKAWKEHILVNGWFWERLDPLPNMEEVFRQINRLAREGHQVYFLSHRQGKDAKRQSEKWLYAQGIDYPTVLLVEKSPDKVPLLKALNIHFYVDDKLETMNELMQTADDERWRMDGRGFYLLDRPYNRTGRRNDVSVAISVKAAMVGAGLWRVGDAS